MAVALRDITVDNWQTCIHLQLAEGQDHLLASNLYSLAEAWVEPALRPRAVYDDDTMIGFVMYVYDPAQACYWIPRFMIDARCQGMGYGRAAMQAVIDELRGQRPEAPIMISVTPDNEPARNLYLGLGFADTGHNRRGEDILRLD